MAHSLNSAWLLFFSKSFFDEEGDWRGRWRTERRQKERKMTWNWKIEEELRKRKLFFFKKMVQGAKGDWIEGKEQYYKEVEKGEEREQCSKSEKKL